MGRCRWYNQEMNISWNIYGVVARCHEHVIRMFRSGKREPWLSKRNEKGFDGLLLLLYSFPSTNVGTDTYRFLLLVQL